MVFKMNSRERVVAALNHRQPDRVPIDCGGHRSSNFSVEAYKNLRQYLGLESKPLYLYDVVQQLVIPDEDILEMFGIDVVDFARGAKEDASLWKDWEQNDGTLVKVPVHHDMRREGQDTWLYNKNGKRLGVQKASSLYFEQTSYPYLDADEDSDFSDMEEAFHDNMWAEIGTYPAPYGFEGEGLKKREEFMSRVSGSGKALYGTFGGNIHENGSFMFGMENWLAYLACEPEMVERFLDKLLEQHMKNLEIFLKHYKGRIQVIGFGDDLGAQNAPQMSPQMYRTMIKPYHKKMWEYVHKTDPDVKICLHCCGSIFPLLDDLIDAGVDAINPVQISCENMDVYKLKETFGKDLVFWGGGCDVQTILTNGTKQEVKDSVRRNLDAMYRDGGYVFQQVHNILANVPPQNIVAMFEAVKEYR